MRVIIAAALMFGAAQAPAATVEVGSGDWSQMPMLVKSGDVSPNARAVSAVHSLIEKDECRIPGQTKRKLDLSVDFLAQFKPDGQVDRVVLEKVGCSQIHSVLGGAVVELIQSGAYKPTGENRTGWYRGKVDLYSR